MMYYTDPRYEKLIKQVENKLKKINVLTSDFDNLTSEQESELEILGNKITKVINQVWDETNYTQAREMWRIQHEASDQHEVIQYLV